MFAGGLSTQLAPHIANIDTAAICENVNLETGAIKPFNSLETIEPATDDAVVWYKNNYSYHPKGSRFCNMLETGFIATSSGLKKSKDGKTWHNLGIEAPMEPMSVTPNEVDTVTPRIALKKSAWGSNKYVQWQNTTGKTVKARLRIPPLTEDLCLPTLKELLEKHIRVNENLTITAYLTVQINNGTKYYIDADTAVQRWTKEGEDGRLGDGPESTDKHARASYGKAEYYYLYEGIKTYFNSQVFTLNNYDTIKIALRAYKKSTYNTDEFASRFQVTADINTNENFLEDISLNTDITIELLDESGETHGELAANDYRWCYTYYNANDGAESAPSPYTDATTIGRYDNSGGYWLNSSATLGNIKASKDPQVTHIRVYRIGDSSQRFRLALEIPNRDAIVIDNTATKFLGDMCPTIGYTVPPIVNTLATAYGMLLGSKDDTLYFSDENNPLLWNPLNYIKFDDNITGLGTCSLGILVFTAFRTYLISGNTATSFYKQLLYENIGCINQGSIVSTATECIWQSSVGIFRLGAGGLQNLTLNRIGINLETIHASTVTADCYYGVTDTKIICINFNLGGAIYYIAIADITGIVTANNSLTVVKARKLAAFTGKPMSFTWRSNWLQTSMTLLKNYKSVYVYAEGDVDYKIYVSNKVAAQGKLRNGDVSDIKVDQLRRNGYYMQVEFSGTGTVYELQYISEDRQNVQ